MKKRMHVDKPFNGFGIKGMLLIWFVVLKFSVFIFSVPYSKRPNVVSVQDDTAAQLNTVVTFFCYFCYTIAPQYSQDVLHVY